jgi:glycosyltransferase involved in cell wall biosynthesis
MNNNDSLTLKNNSLISIIIPVFQVEKYLDKCLSSIINQTYKNLEIIIIDDGSTDNCPEICNKYQAEDSRIKVIHKNNEGLSRTRNIGLSLARGEFVSFVDSDDWIETNMYEVLITELKKSNVDIVVCSYQVEYEDKNNEKNKFESIEKRQYTSEEALKMIINSDGYIMSFVWNKLYRKSLLNDINFIDGKIHEDTLWTAKVIGKAKLIKCINYPFYHYLYRNESLSHNKQYLNQKFHDLIYMYEQRLEYIHKYYPTIETLAQENFQKLCCLQYLEIGLNNRQYDVDKRIRRELYQHFKKFGIKSILKFNKAEILICGLIFYACPLLLEKIFIFYKKITKHLIHYHIIRKNIK